MRRGFLVVAVLAALVLGADPAAAAPPGDTPPRVGVPANIYAVGDSITTATGTGNLGAETPANSWVTGTNGSVNSMRARLSIPSGSAVTLATNGRRMQDFDDQANQLPSTAQYVVVELGGNDLCRPSVAEMTSVATYRTQFRNGLAAVASRAPNALIFVASIPDIYNLWYLRGAPSSVNPHVAEDTGQAGQARLYWDNGLIDVIPCKSLLDNPTSTAPADEARRQQVRARNLAFNQVLAEECGAVLRCRFDGHGFFDLSSNRTNPPNGPIAPHANWWFRDIDISHNSGFWSFLCPAPGVLDGGTVCGDHFHPSLSGQAKLAQGGHELSYQFLTDSTAPTATITPGRAPDGNGVYAHEVEVGFGGTDANGVRGQEVRVQDAAGVLGPWQQHLGLAPPVTISETGTSYVQVRTLDVNGNLSASVTQAITIDPNQFGTIGGTVSGPDGPLEGIQLTLTPGGATTSTAADGSYAFADVVVGDYAVAASPVACAWLGDAGEASVPGGGSVTVDLTLAPEPPGPHGLTDVPAWVEDAVRWAVDGCNDPPYMEGYPDQTFRPREPITRGAVVRAVWRIEGQPAASTPNAFTDTPGWVDDAVSWAVGEGLMTGYPGNVFRPLNDITRAEVARLLYRLAGSPPQAPGGHGMSDVPPWVDAAVTWLVGEGHASGYPDGTFRPNSPITRAEFARMAYRINS